MNGLLNGVGVFVRKGDKILLGRRLNSDGHGTFAIPGGKVDFGETCLATAARELYEESAIDVRNSVPKDSRFITAFPPRVNHYGENASNPIVPIFEAGSVAVLSNNIHMMVRLIVCDLPDEAIPVVTEPHKCAGWIWVPWTEIHRWALYQEQKTNEAVARYLEEPSGHQEQKQEGTPSFSVDMTGFSSEISELNGAHLFDPLFLVAKSGWSPFGNSSNQFSL